MTRADRKKLEDIVDGLMEAFPVFFKRVIRGATRPTAGKFDPRKMVLMVVRMHGPVRMSTIGRHMGISKPYMTALVDSLIDEGLVKRVPDPDDRRVINIRITETGEKETEEFLKGARKTVIKNLSSLDKEDISALHEMVHTIKAINSKLDALESERH